VHKAFLAQLDFIQLASSCTQLSTSSPHYATLLAPTQAALMAVFDIKEKNRPSKEINQLSTVSEGIPALGWVTLVSLTSHGSFVMRNLH
jgi:adenylyl cyclase-associated protein